METLNNKLKLLGAIINFQSECPPIEKTEIATIRTKSGGEYQYKFAPLPIIMQTIQPFLSINKLGIFHTKPDIEYSDILVLKTYLFHESGEFIWSISKESVSKNSARMSSVQGIGNVTTFLTRYHVSNLLNISVMEDLDGNTFPQTEKKRAAQAAGQQFLQYQSKLPKAEEKENPNFIYDSSKNKRYNKATKKLIDDYQKLNNLITTQDWLAIEGLLIKNQVSSKQFAKWLEFAYTKKFYDISQDEVPHIMDILNNDIEVIMDVPETKDAEKYFL